LQVFGAVYRNINDAGPELFFQLFCKNALAADFRQGTIQDFVSLCFNDDKICFNATFFEQVLYVIGLPEGQFTATCSDFYMHDFYYLLLASSFICFFDPNS
jgi:hypothetical protein